MSRRLIYISFGAVAGVLAVRRAASAAQRYTPAGVQTRLSTGFGGFGDSVRAFLDEVRVAAAEREQELRTLLGLDGTHDLVDADLPGDRL